MRLVHIQVQLGTLHVASRLHRSCNCITTKRRSAMAKDCCGLTGLRKPVLTGRGRYLIKNPRLHLKRMPICVLNSLANVR